MEFFLARTHNEGSGRKWGDKAPNWFATTASALLRPLSLRFPEGIFPLPQGMTGGLDRHRLIQPTVAFKYNT